MLGALTELPFGDEALDFRGLMMFSVVARLREGVSLEASQAAVDVAAVDIERDAPGMFDRPRDFLVVEATRGAFRPEARGEVSRYAGTLFVATGGLLLVACVNIAGLYSVRAAGRQREIAVRLALGAGRRRVVQQLMSEALLLSCVGGVGAIFVAIACLPLLERLHLPAGVDPSLHLDVRLLSFTLALAVATGVVFGVAPALGSSGRGAGAVLRQVRGGVRRWRGVDARSLLVVAQVAVTVVLLVGAGLLVRTVVNLWSVERGFDTDRVLVASFELQRAGYDEAEGRIFLRGVAARARGLTGVRSAAVSADVPLGGVAGSLPLYIEALSGIEPGVVRQSLVGAGYFATLGARLEAGRDFDDFDREGSEGVVIVNRALANLAWPDRDPLGKQVRSGVEGRASTVVGVVSDYRHADLRREPEPRLYWPIEQQYSFAKGSGTRRLMVRTEGEPLGMAPAVRAVVRAIDPELPVFDLVSMRQLVAGTIIRERQSAAILIAFSVIALALSAIGLFGVLAYAVAQRRSEIGIRCALGALESQVAASVVRGGVGLAAAGVVLGSAAAAASARVLSSWLYGIRPHDPVTYATIAVLVLLVAGLASFVPARRATRVDPAVALRGEG
jgi:predicted permease